MILRDAELSDRDFFLALRNDEVSVRFSYTKQEVGKLEHARWWKETNDHLLVAEHEFYDGIEKRLGLVRLTPLDDATCEVHFILAPEFRGRGLAAGILAMARGVAKELGYTHLIARVDAPNTKSLRAFLREGYTVSSAGTLLLERDV